MTDIARKTWTVLRILFARLRFVAVFVVAALVIGYWDNIKNHVDKWTRPPVAPDALAHAAHGDIEYYCPMHPDVVREQPGQCPKCGMPLVKRKRGEAQLLPADVLARVTLTPRRLELGGIQTSPVEYRELLREVRSLALIDYDETRLARLSARVGGRADELYVQYTGQSVKRGDPLYSLYSPDVFTSLRQYLLARKRVNDLPKDASPDTKNDASVDYNATMQKLVLWGITQEQLDHIDEEFDRTGRIPANLTVTSPIGGIVVRKDLNQGQYVQVGESPYTVADLSKLWLQLKLYEHDVPLVQIGNPVEIAVEAIPNELFSGTVTFKSFQLDPETRTLDARVEVDNPGLRLRPGMYATAAVRIPVGARPATSAPSTRAAAPTTTPPSRPASSPAASPPAQPSVVFREALKPYLAAGKLLSEDKSQNVMPLLHQTVQKLSPAKDAEPVAAGYARLADAVNQASGDQSLAGLRKNFQEVSAAMIEIGKSVGIPADGPAVKVFRCPMKKANWLQEGDATANPYYGSEMYTCGSAVEPLPRVSPTAAISPTRPTTIAPRNRVLSIPRSAVIDTGRSKIVYVESSPGVFDMHAVKLGPLASINAKPGEHPDEYYPVVEGLAEGDRVVTVGTFLVDAENRLNPTRAATPAGTAMEEPAGSTGHKH
jgi:Cu(I)/Ag(I) efflux system membrane fusion protein